MPRDTRSLMIKAIPRLENRDEKAKRLEAKLAKLGVGVWNKGPRGLQKLGLTVASDDHRDLERGELFKGAHEILGDREFVRFVRRLKEVLAKKAAKAQAERQGDEEGEAPAPSRSKDSARRSSRDSKSREGKSSARRSSRDAAGSTRAKVERSEKKPRSSSKGDSSRKARKPDAEPLAVVPEHIPDEEAEQLTLSGGAGLTISGEGLALPDESGMGLALPESGEGLALPDESGIGLALPDEEEHAGGGGMGDFDLDTLEIAVGQPAGAAQADEPLSIRFGDDEGAQDEDDTDPSRAADRALARYARTGDLEELAQAKKLFKAAVKSAEGAVAQGAARGGLAKAYFLEGDLEKARDMAKKALKAFPHSPAANAVVCQVEWEGEVERERLKAKLARADHALSSGDHAEVKAVAKDLAKSHPEEPFAGLLLLAIECDKDTDDLSEAVARAWKHYPASPGVADILLGASIERALARSLVRWMLAKVEGDESAKVLGETVKETESKKNVYAGAFQLILGLTRATLAARKLQGPERQQYALWMAQGLFFAQHYDAAKDAFQAAIKHDREGDLVGELRRLDTQCGVMKRAFDRPGVKAQRGNLEGVGLVRYREAIAGRLKLVLEGLEGDRAKLDAKEAKIVDAILADPARKKAIQKLAKKAGGDDPFAALDALEVEAGSIGGAPAEGKKGGLFGRMKAAAQDALDKAKAAAQGAINASKQKEARRALGEHLREDRPDKGWGDAELDAFLEKAAAIEPRLGYLESLADELRAAAGKAS